MMQRTNSKHSNKILT